MRIQDMASFPPCVQHMLLDWVVQVRQRPSHVASRLSGSLLTLRLAERKDYKIQPHQGVSYVNFKIEAPRLLRDANALLPCQPGVGFQNVQLDVSRYDATTWSNFSFTLLPCPLCGITRTIGRPIHFDFASDWYRPFEARDLRCWNNQCTWVPDF